MPYAASLPIPGMPGDRALALYTRQVAEGRRLHPEIMPRLTPLLNKYRLPLPEPIAGGIA